jgi:hypothetical protein
MLTTTTEARKTRSREALAGATFLGPCEVLAAAAGSVRVRMPDGNEESAELALAFPYRAARADLLLVIGGSTGHWVIGVIRGQGRASLEFHGDVELRSVGGKVEITADRGIEMRSKSIDIGAEKIKVVAEAVTETVSTLFTRVRDMMTVQAGEARQLVRGQWFSQAKRAQIQTEDAVAINGRQIHLG